MSLLLVVCVYARVCLYEYLCVSVCVFMCACVCAVTPHLVAPHSVITSTNAEYAWLYS